VQIPGELAKSQASQDPVQALSQQYWSGEQVVPATHPAATVRQACPRLLLHAPVESHVPAQKPKSSWPLSAVHAPPAHVWHAPEQSLRLRHPVHLLVTVSHFGVAPVQCLGAVHATHEPLAAQAGPVRPMQSLSVAHFAHLLPKQSGASDGQSRSALQVPGASTVASAAASTGGTSGGASTGGASGTVTSDPSGVVDTESGRAPSG
jgi:hypothetical protein